ncbi:glutathione S-transferase C-terminal domain-containing protein [Sphingobium yanoikuyae]|uniref:Glutathione transferase GstA n=1 Tax=Sphingobium yanoikuyae TaxID=13690 RepID=A0A291MY03_SPHYA|nr:glutathione S-transferase C-terminal domain-containing protein [Sphingobium yanoikuyae]ATI79999.1 glutathione transferase GstA [Sphingobium yanoikuyae]
MKLFAHPGASSMSVHILLRETGLPFELEMIDVKAKVRPDGTGYREVAGRGLVPLLQLADGASITENTVIAQFICDAAGRADLMPRQGSIARYQVMEWQSFVASELDKAFTPLFWGIGEDEEVAVRANLVLRLSEVDRALGQLPFLTGDRFTAADAYMFVIASWALFFAIDLSAMPNLRAYLARIGQRRSVTDALAAEGPGLVPIIAA